ncbi:5-formyltetrahydrofolate cyclo-ligase [Thamnocephalis sphaerospora]|uniref:5-formyltetrahydrofolate cyclo-ligase n=1 Tax=Thamnocephalis sphaerospora TaxID=78915 RepID=A0A4P9XRM6_9FUNG|nr:5-formyltetrahydrofolate cyclo-ligase [Thamnocephalis sphaerospora]|eukprot:RKP08602.1 5-formyltetrahydrofolate cyclo-ligase [Thamnocephalis sphaerospora]
MQTSVRSLKNALRKQVRQRLSTLPADTIAADTERVTEKLLQLPEYSRSQRVSIYVSMHGEVATRRIIEDLFQSGKACYVPRWHGDLMEMVRLRSMEDYISLPLNRWGIPEPAHGEQRDEAFADGGLDLIVMPGLAFDLQGNRLGHGKGYYDRYLEQCEKFARDAGTAPPYTVALGLSAQMVDEEIPHDHFDRRPACLLTPDNVIRQ